MRGVSWQEGCPVPLEALRLVRVTHFDFEGQVSQGELVVAAAVADEVVQIFERLYALRFPIARMERIERYGGDDDASMAANNSSAFNCRRVAGSRSWSEHAYGTAIDLNPVQNPYVTARGVFPPAGRAYLDRSKPRPGMVVPGTVVEAFERFGWGWGGRWRRSKDYQHFSKRGR
ncbi:MAG: M15 family peptidase [Deltaproteobacteria bacterium]|nr:MAG: M15 family peptidase [Deltaproteobacteria bacterium]